MLLVAPSVEHLKYVIQMHFAREEATNNTAEYEGLLVRLRIAAELGIKNLALIPLLGNVVILKNSYAHARSW